MSGIPRREFIRRAASALVLPYLANGLVGCDGGGMERNAQGQASQLAGRYLVRARAAAELIGQTYLEELAPDRLESEIETMRASIESLVGEARTETDAIQRLHEAVRQDFVALRIYRLEGWTMSLTELTLCALAALDSEQIPSS